MTKFLWPMVVILCALIIASRIYLGVKGRQREPRSTRASRGPSEMSEANESPSRISPAPILQPDTSHAQQPQKIERWIDSFPSAKKALEIAYRYELGALKAEIDYRQIQILDRTLERKGYVKSLKLGPNREHDALKLIVTEQTQAELALYAERDRRTNRTHQRRAELERKLEIVSGAKDWTPREQALFMRDVLTTYFDELKGRGIELPTSVSLWFLEVDSTLLEAPKPAKDK